MCKTSTIHTTKMLIQNKHPLHLIKGSVELRQITYGP